MTTCQTALAWVVDWEMVFKWLPAAGAFATLAAVTVTMTMTWWTHHQRATFEMIDRMYSLCHTVHGHLLKDWRLMHLFIIGNDPYSTSCERIKNSFDEKERNELIEKERLIAIHLFVAYEQVFFHLKYTSWHLFSRRAFLRLMQSYFTDRVLNNPRLKAFFEADDSGESLHLEKESAKALKEALSNSKVRPDPYGPFIKRESQT